MHARLVAAFAVLLAALFLIACEDSGGHNSPSNTPIPSNSGQASATSGNPSPTSTTAPPVKGKLEVSVKPNPVPFSGQPVAAGLPCAGQANTWFWDNVLTETGGSTVTITSVTTQVDNLAPNTVAPPQAMVVPAKGSYSRNLNMCFANPSGSHSVQVLYKGVDASGNEVSVSAAVTTLQPK